MNGDVSVTTGCYFNVFPSRAPGDGQLLRHETDGADGASRAEAQHSDPMLHLLTRLHGLSRSQLGVAEGYLFPGAPAFIRPELDMLSAYVMSIPVSCVPR